MSDTRAFRELVLDLANRHGSLSALAQQLGLSPSRLSRVANGTPGASMEVVNCLRLAQLAGQSPAQVLRAAGKADVADLLDGLYGRIDSVLPPSLTRAMRVPETAATITGLLELPEPLRSRTLGLIEAAIAVARTEPSSRPSRAHDPGLPGSVGGGQRARRHRG